MLQALDGLVGGKRAAANLLEQFEQIIFGHENLRAKRTRKPGRRTTATVILRARGFRVYAPFSDQAVAHDALPSRGNLPEAFGRKLAVAFADTAGGAEDSDDIFVLKEIFGANPIFRYLGVIHFPTVAQSLAADEALAEGVLEDMVFGHEFAERIDVAGIDALDEFDDDIDGSDAYFGWCAAHVGLSGGILEYNGNADFEIADMGERLRLCFRFAALNQGRILDLAECGCETESILATEQH
jgi:hypothetical protein